MIRKPIRPAVIVIVSGALFILAVRLASSQTVVSSLNPFPSTFSGATCNSCTMNGMTVSDPFTLDGVTIKPTLAATTASLGGSVLLLGARSCNTTNVAGALSGMSVQASPNGDPGAGVSPPNAWVSSSGVVTTCISALVAVTPTAQTYNLRIIQ